MAKSMQIHPEPGSRQRPRGGPFVPAAENTAPKPGRRRSVLEENPHHSPFLITSVNDPLATPDPKIGCPQIPKVNMPGRKEANTFHDQS